MNCQTNKVVNKIIKTRRKSCVEWRESVVVGDMRCLNRFRGENIQKRYSSETQVCFRDANLLQRRESAFLQTSAINLRLWWSRKRKSCRFYTRILIASWTTPRFEAKKKYTFFLCECNTLPLVQSAKAGKQKSEMFRIFDLNDTRWLMSPSMRCTFLVFRHLCLRCKLCAFFKRKCKIRLKLKKMC